MGLIERELRQVWDGLRGQALQRTHMLRAVRIQRLRGIADLRIPFSYPVSVLAGPKGCGKSTVLFACACAYRDPDRRASDLSPGSLFPNFTHGREGGLSDMIDNTELGFDYLHDGDSYAMDWKRRKSWSRSYRGRKGGGQPERTVWLRTLANLDSPFDVSSVLQQILKEFEAEAFDPELLITALYTIPNVTNPSEVRRLIQQVRNEFETETVDPEYLIFASRILPRGYRNLSRIIRGRSRDLLFTETEGQEAQYSEFHMSAGERAILQIYREISQLEGALVLIDEVETGLHPYMQQQTMLELQRLALRHNLQIIVTSHSPVVLDSVPEEARLFLDRDAVTGEVRLMPAWRDIFQKALYGQSQDRLSILCEDKMVEAIILGVLDVLTGEMNLRHDDFEIGRNTGRDKFPAHVRTLGLVDRLRDFIMVLDGDACDLELEIKAAAERHGHSVQPLFLPGEAPPEQWIWDALQSDPERYGGELGLDSDELEGRMRRCEQLTEGSIRQQEGLQKTLHRFADESGRTKEDIGRLVGRVEMGLNRGDMATFRTELEEQINAWRRGV